jgi:hypothetical protein
MFAKKNYSFTIYDAAYERNNRARQYKKDHQSWVTSRVKDTTPRSAQSNDSEVPLNGNSGAEPVESEVPQVKRLGKNKRAMSLEISNFQNPEVIILFIIPFNVIDSIVSFP